MPDRRQGCEGGKGHAAHRRAVTSGRVGTDWPHGGLSRGAISADTRQAVTIGRAVRAGRARVRATPVDATVDGEALRDLVAEAAAEARLIEVPVNRRPWMATGIRVARGEAVTWLVWGRAYLIRPLGLGAGPSL